MIQVVCNICKRNLNRAPDPSKPDFCEKHEAYAQDFLKEMAELLTECNQDMIKRANKLRERFLQRITEQEKRQAIKAVGA